MRDLITETLAIIATEARTPDDQASIATMLHAAHLLQVALYAESDGETFPRLLRQQGQLDSRYHEALEQMRQVVS